jgi:ATP-dependent helicase HrpA
VRVFATAAEQAAAMRAGTRRLLLLTIPSPRRALERSLPNDAKLALARTTSLGTMAALLDDCTAAAIDDLLAERGGPAWDEPAFADLRDAVRSGLPARAHQVVATVRHIVGAVAAIEDRLAQLGAASLAPSVADVRRHLARLVHPGFVTGTGARRLGDLLRYLCAIEVRLDKLPEDPRRDLQRLLVVQRLEDELAALREELAPGPVPEDVVAIGWMLEELRVSTFAQSVGTPVPISEQRVIRALDRAANGP